MQWKPIGNVYESSCHFFPSTSEDKFTEDLEHGIKLLLDCHNEKCGSLKTHYLMCLSNPTYPNNIATFLLFHFSKEPQEL